MNTSYYLTKHIPCFESFRDGNPNFNGLLHRHWVLLQPHDGCKEWVSRTRAWEEKEWGILLKSKRGAHTFRQTKIVPHHYQEWNWGNTLTVAGCVRDGVPEVVGCGRQNSGASMMSMSYSLELVVLLPSTAPGLCRSDSVKDLEMGCSPWISWVAPMQSRWSLKESEEEMRGRKQRLEHCQSQTGRRKTRNVVRPEANKDKKIASPLEPPEGTQPRQHLGFSSARPTPASDLHNSKIINLRHFKPLSLC